MKRNIIPGCILVIPLFLISFQLNSCTDRNERLGKSFSQNSNFQSAQILLENRLRKATFFLENSESMFGYVNASNEYVKIVTELAEKPEFVAEGISREFRFINGAKPIQNNLIGYRPEALKGLLNISGYDRGDITKSDLNGMFQIALASAGSDSISILISDCIYDIGEDISPLSALAVEGKATRSQFIQRLGQGNLQTIIIKLYSSFNGKYFYASRRGYIQINHQRPYYVFIFGESELLNNYFDEEYISSLEGYYATARFLKVNDRTIPYQATTENKRGDFKFDKSNKNKLNSASSDRSGQNFQFSIAVDFSALPFPDSYFLSEENYTVSEGNYSIAQISNPPKTIYGLQFTPSHLITINSKGNLYGNLKVALKYTIPKWISETSIDNENTISFDSTCTYGFKTLIDGISEAYEFKNDQQDIATFRFEILK